MIGIFGNVIFLIISFDVQKLLQLDLRQGFGLGVFCRVVSSPLFLFETRLLFFWEFSLSTF